LSYTSLIRILQPEETKFEPSRATSQNKQSIHLQFHI
jgi:hypothetical protein